MHIAMLTNTHLPHVGGVARSVDSATRWLRAQGNRILVAAPYFEGTPEVEEDVVRVRALQRLGSARDSLAICASETLRCLRWRPHPGTPRAVGRCPIGLA